MAPEITPDPQHASFEEALSLVTEGTYIVLKHWAEANPSHWPSGNLLATGFPMSRKLFQ